MKKLFPFILLVAVAMTFTFCGGSGSTDSTGTDGDSSADKASGEVELVTIENDKIGFTILAPKEAKVLADTEYNFTTSQVLGANEINVSVGPAVGEIKTVDAFKADLDMMMAKNITKAEATEGGFMAVNEQGTLLVTVYHRVGKVMAKVSVPPSKRDIAEKIAMSVTSTK